MTTGHILDFNLAKRQGELARIGIDADDIKDRLRTDVRGFVNWLYSGRAYFTKTQARIGNIQGEPGSSLAIDLNSGLWKDHATEDGGDLISLYRAWRGYQGDANFVLSLKEIAHDFLKDQIELERPAWQPTPAAQIEKRKAELGSKPRPENLELGAPVSTYKYYDLHGHIIASVVRFEPDGTRESKTFRPWCFKTIDGQQKWAMGAPDMRPLYRLPDIATASSIVLCEGEGKADALTELGIPATSAMQGAKAPIEKTDWSPLAGKTVVIWPDRDKPGFEYADIVSIKLISLGCKVLRVTPPAGEQDGWDAIDCLRESGNPHSLIEAAAAPPKPRIRLLTVSQLSSLPPPEWLIDDLITVNGLSELWGRSGSLKTFAALDMGLCIATGADWHGRKVRKGSVAYLAAEGARGLGQRALGWIQNRGRDLPEPDFRIIPHGLTLPNQTDLLALIEALKGGVSMIVIDTLLRTFGPGNLNQPSDMSAFVAACEQLREGTGAHVMVVHHGGKDSDKNELGNEALRNASDTVIHIRRRTNSIELINEAPRGKQKDFDEFKTIYLRPVKVSYQHKDQELSTLILNADESPQSGSEEPETNTEQKFGPVEKRIIAALEAAGEPLGATRLQAMVNVKAKATIYNSLDNLIRKKRVEKLRSKDDSHDQWRLT